jgi:hypothetical protein
MSEATADGTPILITNLDVGVAAGGYYYDEPGGGGDGPSGGEAVIEDMFASWSAALTGGDEWTSYMADGAMFWDSDANGYYDYLEIGGDGGVFIYDPDTDTWIYREYNSSE